MVKIKKKAKAKKKKNHLDKIIKLVGKLEALHEKEDAIVDEIKEIAYEEKNGEPFPWR